MHEITELLRKRLHGQGNHTERSFSSIKKNYIEILGKTKLTAFLVLLCVVLFVSYS